nr:BTAD domain-containing putative transcriptional regulator [Gordonia sp. LAM0048]
MSRTSRHLRHLSLSPGVARTVSWEDDLAFTPDEAADALSVLDKHHVPAASAVQATGGWVTGVLFEAWRFDNEPAAPGSSWGPAERDTLHGYLSAQILDSLDERDRDFLVRTAVLPEITREAAQMLGFADAGAQLAALRRAHLPVMWSRDGQSLRHHTRFREFLLARLKELDGDVVLGVIRRSAEILGHNGRDEEAVEVLLSYGLPEQARVHAEQVILDIADRSDLDVVDRWLHELDEGPGTSDLTVARLMVGIARDDFAACVTIADELAAKGVLVRLAARSGRAAGLMAWALLLSGRVDDARELLDAAEGPEVEGIRYAMRLWVTDDADADDIPPLSGTPLDAIVLIAQYYSGRLRPTPRATPMPWIRQVAGLYEAAALRAAGRTDEAIELYEREFIDQRPDRGGFTHAVLGSEILLEAGRVEEAEDLVRSGLSTARGTGARVFEVALRLAEIRIAIHSNRFDDARRLVQRLRDDPVSTSIVYYTEILDTTDAYLQLVHNTSGSQPSRDDEAVRTLRRTVDSMRRGGRLLALPGAAVYLAEAEWRTGNPDRADEATEIALAAAESQGTNHALLQALSNFPAVLSRRLDAEPGADSPWHALGRALVTLDRAPLTTVGAPRIHLVEFGPTPMLLHLGHELRPAITKSIELLAHLLAHGGTSNRKSLLEDLFDGRQDDSAHAYLRQAIRRLREVLPDPGMISTDAGVVSVHAQAKISSDSVRFENHVALAARLRGDSRLDALEAALEVFDRGPYLDDLDSSWVENRRDRLRELATGARVEAAALALELGLLQRADQLLTAALRDDAYREAAWRLAMTVAHARGDDDGVVAAYRRCGDALADIGLTPAPATRQLLEQLRR